jgi:muramidase (phage lysozyme)
MSTYRGRDDATDILLDLIAEHESRGNYNAVIGDINASDDLSRKTLAEIYGLMADLRAIGRPSTAVGRYQIIRKTLQTLQASKGLPDSAKFTPELQDGMAVSLMVGRGYSRWWTGAMSDQEFAHNLSMEWASLPDPDRGGASHYDGDGVNHAGTSLAHVYDGLARARAAKGSASNRAADDAPAASPPAGGIAALWRRLFG